MQIEKAIEKAIQFYKENPNIKVPNTTREWLNQRCPPELTRGKINTMDFSLGELLRAVNPKAAQPRAENVNYDLDTLGMLDLDFEGNTANYICGSCGHSREGTRSTILKWLKSGIKFCPVCRKAPGAKKPADYYQDFLPEDFSVTEIIRAGGNTKIVVKHDCGFEREYSSRHIINPDRDYLVCSGCTRDLRGYASEQEKLVTEHLIASFPELEIKTQVRYADLVDTTRRWVLDIFIPEINLALEVTTKGNGFPNYFNNLNSKIDLLTLSEYNAAIAYSKAEAYDIVRSLVKAKEV